MAIRYSEIILQIEANHSNMALLDRTVTSLVWALYNCGESDTLHGLAIWLKPKHGKRFEWIVHVAEQASGNLEKAATGYLHILHDEHNKSMDNFMKEFIQKQLTDCFYHTAREAWFSYGNWCYRWGKKLMEAKIDEQTSSAASINDLNDIKLTKRNIVSIQETLKDKFEIDTIEKIIEVLNKNIINVISDDSAEDLDTNLNSENTTEILKQELKNVCDLDEDQLRKIFAIWRQAQKGVYSYYEEATRAYFKYLAIESEEVSKRSDMANSDNNEVEDCTFVTTTLRLLRLIVKHAIGLQIAALTDKEPETNYERSFKERFGAYIEAALKELQKSNNEANPSEYWQKIKQLYNVFQQRPLRGNSSMLRVSEISPVLANMHNTTIAMPGVDTYAQPAIYIKSVDVTTFIFTSTKTKPKKLLLWQ
ncbi:hypothetical protein EVAR_67336_1 [Eumeta japonica]|uniref:Uncharacterized protein n=1 Tax=Eumeta variegata TaxID=151549 RepID=A0A4C2AAZ4_EUMVA|nr:hypothetical protein EVAR_67336_1 [Eumeta japonica]